MERELGPISKEEATALNADFVAYTAHPTTVREQWYDLFTKFSLDHREFARTIKKGQILLIHHIGVFMLVRVEEVVEGSISEVDVRVTDGITGSWRIENCAKLEEN